MAPKERDALIAFQGAPLDKAPRSFGSLEVSSLSLPNTEYLDANDIRVQAPSPIVFVCGGEVTDIAAPQPKSLRDAFLKIIDFPPIRKARLFLAEEINLFYLSRRTYDDLLEFETDLAQITDLVLLFCESEGSLAELGAFAMTAEISQRILVVMRDKYYKKDSFVMLGPILALKNTYGEQVTYVLDDSDINITGTTYRDLNISTLKERLIKPIQKRLEIIREPTTFNKQKSGHLIKLIVGLIQEYGALTIDEIHEILHKMEIHLTAEKAASYLLCAEAVEWIKADKKGGEVYYFAKSLKHDAVQYMFDGNLPETNKLRRRMSIRLFWKEKDPDRFRGITQYSGEMA